ncbi:MAG: hypothetical protein J1F11_00080 [Oscillospiraceae bacterium]|nr:hypothetical protein [Oscillospiraceae bacterium]
MMINQKEKKKAKFRFSFILLFIFASFAVCFVFYMKEDFVVTSEMLDNTTDAVVYVDPVGQSSSVINPVPAGERQDDSYYKDVAFIGNRALAGLADYEYVPSGNMLISDAITPENFNSVILSVDGVESGIADAVIRKNVSGVYIMIGMGSVTSDHSGLFDEMEAFVDAVVSQAPDTEIYLMSLLPVPAGSESSVAYNSDIDAYNSELLKFANKKNVRYLDVNTGFKGNDGKLPDSAAEANGVRLKKEKYGELSEYILTHIAN